MRTREEWTGEGIRGAQVANLTITAKAEGPSSGLIPSSAILFHRWPKTDTFAYAASRSGERGLTCPPLASAAQPFPFSVWWRKSYRPRSK